jgi:AraC family transcriptional regulator of arabinose operon
MRALISFPGELHAGRTVTDDPAHVSRPEGMDAWILNLTTAGRGQVGGAEGLTSAPGRLLLWPAGVPHRYGALAGDWEHWWIYFHPRQAWLELLAWPEVQDGVLTLDLAQHDLLPRVTRLFHEVAEVMASGRIRRIALAQALLEQLLLWCDAANPGAAAGLDPRLTAAIDYALPRLERRLGIAELARISGCSPSRFAHLFTAQLGIPPLAWLERTRIERAREQLLLSGRPIADIGAECGFNDATWFARVFKRHAGMTPRAYRRAGGRVPLQTRRR